jgi:hypothetical protein
VVLSGGTFNTPQLLKPSGIGPSAKLTALSIPVLVNLPGVCANLQDHYEIFQSSLTVISFAAAICAKLLPRAITVGCFGFGQSLWPLSLTASLRATLCSNHTRPISTSPLQHHREENQRLMLSHLILSFSEARSIASHFEIR